MRIDHLEVENFKKFAHFSLDLHPRFTLLVGENGSGKTSILDALAVAAGIWLAVDLPDSILQGSRRPILKSEIRLEQETKGDRVQFRERLPSRVQVRGSITGKSAAWARQIKTGGKRTTNAEAKEALDLVTDVYAQDAGGTNVLCPVLAYYGAGRAWLASNQLTPRPKPNGPARRWAAFYDCFNERIRFDELTKWFGRESAERGNRGGRWRPGFQAVRAAILRCVPEATDVWFDADLDQIALSIAGQAQPFGNLSAGQRMMLALAADIAIKAVTQNAFLIPPDEEGLDGRWPAVLEQTPGLILIDELDVHLHPRWQRRVSGDLKAAFPAMQFVCTSHSPQVVGENPAEQIRLLSEDGAHAPPRSLGIDSSRVLEELMDALPRNAECAAQLAQVSKLIDEEDLPGARAALLEVAAQLGEDDPEVTRARALMAFLESGA